MLAMFPFTSHFVGLVLTARYVYIARLRERRSKPRGCAKYAMSTFAFSLREIVMMLGIHRPYFCTLHSFHNIAQCTLHIHFCTPALLFAFYLWHTSYIHFFIYIVSYILCFIWSTSLMCVFMLCVVLIVAFFILFFILFSTHYLICTYFYEPN